MTYMARNARALLAPLTILALATITSCNGDDGLVRVRPRIVTEPPAGTELTFDEVVLNRTTVDPVIVVVGNAGEGPLSLQSVRIEGEGASHFLVSSYPKSLSPGARGEIFLRFEPTAIGTHGATLIIDSNDT